MTHDNDEIHVLGFVTEDGLEPILLDKRFDRLACGNEFIIA